MKTLSELIAMCDKESTPVLEKSLKASLEFYDITPVIDGNKYLVTDSLYRLVATILADYESINQEEKTLSNLLNQ